MPKLYEVLGCLVSALPVRYGNAIYFRVFIVGIYDYIGNIALFEDRVHLLGAQFKHKSPYVGLIQYALVEFIKGFIRGIKQYQLAMFRKYHVPYPFHQFGKEIRTEHVIVKWPY